METITITRLRRSLKKYLDAVAKSSKAIIISNAQEDEAVVILSLKEYNSMNETGHLLSSITNRKRLYASIDQLKNSKTAG